MEIRPLSPSDPSALEDVFHDDGGYAMRVHGRATMPNDVDELFTSFPPAASQGQRHTLGLWLDDELVGVADLLVDHPEAGTNYLGLLQIRAARQGRGLAREFHDELVSRFPSADRWRLSVVDTNIDVLGFWERLGYRRTGEVRAWSSSSGARHETILMERPARN